MDFFGFTIKRRTDELEKQLDSFVADKSDDGAVVVAAGGAYGTYIDLEGAAKTEADLVSKYREMALHPEVESAIDDIICESVVDDDYKPSVSINLDQVELPISIKKKIEAEFDNVLKLLDWSTTSYETYKRWYVDGRLYYHAIIDPTAPRDGILELRYVDPRKIRKVREVIKPTNKVSGAPVVKNVDEYFIYNDKGFGAGSSGAYQGNQSTGIKIAKDSIVHVTSGIMDVRSTLVLSHLHKAIKPLNQLRTLEDATVIYRLSRAPERRVFYIDVGNLPKLKAEQYMRDMMARHKNKIVYDSSNGEIRDDRKFMTMLEDFWLPRREGGKGTEISTLPSGQNLGEIADVEYFQKKLYKSLNVPISRLDSTDMYNLGRATEMTRDELKFNNFVERLRRRFNVLFLTILERQLLLKSIITSEDWVEINNQIKIVYARDNYFAELKETEIFNNRLATLQQADVYAGKYFSQQWIKKNVLFQDDDEIKKIQAEMDQEIPETPEPDIEDPKNNFDSQTTNSQPN